MHDPIFGSLKPAELSQICKLMSFDPVVSEQTFRTLSKLSETESLAWLQANSYAVEREICRLGSWSFGDTRDYNEIVRDLAKKMGVASDADRLEQVERSLIVKIWNDAVAKLTPSQVEELKGRAKQIAETYGKSLGGEMTGFAALTAAQMSGFGVYMLGSTVLGAINGALGLGLGFGAFTGLSSLISTVIGPIGWAALGLFAVLKLGAPNYKKVLPVVIFIASQRSLIEGSGFEKRELVQQPAALRLPAKLQTPEISNLRKGTASQPRSVVPALNSNSMVLAFQADALRATRAAKAHWQAKPASQPTRHVASKQDKRIFDLVPDNKLLRDIARDVAREGVDEHFLDFSEADQAAIRVLARERQLIQEAMAIQEKQDAHNAAMEEKQRLRDSRRQVKGTPDQSSGLSDNKRRKVRNVLKATFPNLLFSDRALDRYRDYEGTLLHTSFVAKFRLLDQGDMADKHHVPLTSPKVFQMDCGGKGKLYYRRGNDGHSICVELIGDKNSQPRDILHLQSL